MEQGNSSTKKSAEVKFRVSEKEKNKMQWLADTYANGNLSDWCRYASLEANRVKLKEKKRGI